MINIRKIVKISRPRFWIYLVGPFLFGSAAIYAQTGEVTFFSKPDFWIFLLVFWIFGNYYIYGINDYYDFDTDQHNLKKDEVVGKEYRLIAGDKRWLSISVYSVLAVAIACVPFIVARSQNETHSSSAWLAGVVWACFWFIGYAYSAPPLRFKARRLVDSLSNGYYAFPGIFIYIYATGMLVSLEVFFAAVLWNAGMHFYSAIPDIEADTKAGLNTTAMYFGHRKSLYVASGVWFASLLLLLKSGSFTDFGSMIVIVIGLIYTVLPLISLSSKPQYSVHKMYWFFPYINILCGFAIFLLIALS